MERTYRAVYRHAVYPNIRYAVTIVAESAEQARQKAADWPYMGQGGDYIIEGVN